MLTFAMNFKRFAMLRTIFVMKNTKPFLETKKNTEKKKRRKIISPLVDHITETQIEKKNLRDFLRNNLKMSHMCDPFVFPV